MTLTEDNWTLDPDVVLSVATWAADVGEMTTAREVVDFFEKPWHWPEYFAGWQETSAGEAVEDVATELSLHWDVDYDKALMVAQAFADQGGDGSGMTFAEQVAENTAYIVAEYMIDGGHVAPGEDR